jgi:(E)-4-hydroxy-3-methylbut-2-enyl-diphosphate synthase
MRNQEDSFLSYSKRKSSEVLIGTLKLGADNPIRIQSMTNTDTSDIKNTAEQIIRIVNAGAELVRITVPTSYIAEKIPLIKEYLDSQNYYTPLIADIHFSPKAAEISAEYIEKVRINPGNYTDLKQFKHIEYTDDEYREEIKRIEENFIPLIKICKKNKTALRIGTNHGSLSDRILSRYGDTPMGMTESTMEFLRICKTEDYNQVVISMKASNPIVMIQSVRLLVETMKKENMYYPIHLGVTEAGNDEEGRIKSAVGIGTLLADGIGDTIRVSLTEAPEKEISVANALINIFKPDKLSLYKPLINLKSFNFNGFEYSKRKTFAVETIGGDYAPVVISDIKKEDSVEILQCGYNYNDILKSFEETDLSSDYVFIHETSEFISKKEILQETSGNKKINFISIDSQDFIHHNFKSTGNKNNFVYILDVSNSVSPVHAARTFFIYLIEQKINNPVIIKFNIPIYNEYHLTEASAIIGALFMDGFGNGIWIHTNDENLSKVRELSFGILQACRTRITKTEYISCPSCGRTLFNLEETTAKIKARTAHLKGLKIGIMGCIVNGPGEMADADFGYVGTGKGKITLYKKQEVIKRNIPEEDAVEELLKLIEQYS